MRFVDKGEAKQYLDYVFALVAPGHEPRERDVYNGLQVGEMKGWTDDDLRIILELGQRQLDGLDDRLEQIRGRGQTLFAVVLAFLTFAVGGTFLKSVTGSVVAFICWYSGLALGGLGLLGTASVFATTAQMGSIDTVLLSREELDGSALSVMAAAYPKAVKRSMSAVLARFTVLRDATWLAVVGCILVLVGWALMKLTS